MVPPLKVTGHIKKMLTVVIRTTYDLNICVAGVDLSPQMLPEHTLVSVSGALRDIQINKS